MHLEILDERRIHLVRELAEIPETTCFYLAGGTALSLQLGLRKSYDFYFFSEQRFNSNAILARLKERWADLTVIHMDQDTCDVILDGVQTSFLWYPYPLVSGFITDDTMLPGLKLCGVKDIAVMKLSAIGSRGSRKDFYDLYQIYQNVPQFDSRMLLSCAHRKYGERFDLTYMIAGMSYFEVADGEVLPETFIPADWERVRQFSRREQALLFEMESKRYDI